MRECLGSQQNALSFGNSQVWPQIWLSLVFLESLLGTVGRARHFRQVIYNKGMGTQRGLLPLQVNTIDNPSIRKLNKLLKIILYSYLQKQNKRKKKCVMPVSCTLNNKGAILFSGCGSVCHFVHWQHGLLQRRAAGQPFCLTESASAPFRFQPLSPRLGSLYIVREWLTPMTVLR